MINFLIVGTQRTGSSALADGIGLHPAVACGWEWTLRTPPAQAIRVAEAALNGDFSVLAADERAHMLDVYSDRTCALGFRRLFRASDKWLIHPRLSPALWIDRIEAHIAWLRRRPDIRVIHIVREDNLAWFRSRKIARKSGIHFGSPYPADVRITADLAEARRRVLAKNWVDRRLAALCASNPYLRVSYDEFRQDNLRVLNRALEFLDLDAGQLPSPAEHMRAKPQSGAMTASSVQNHHELEMFLRASGLIRSEI